MTFHVDFFNVGPHRRRWSTRYRERPSEMHLVSEVRAHGAEVDEVERSWVDPKGGVLRSRGAEIGTFLVTEVR